MESNDCDHKIHIVETGQDAWVAICVWCAATENAKSADRALEQIQVTHEGHKLTDVTVTKRRHSAIA